MSNFILNIKDNYLSVELNSNCLTSIDLLSPLRICELHSSYKLNHIESYLKIIDKVRFRALRWRIVSNKTPRNEFI
jgi:hypothetical protein